MINNWTLQPYPLEGVAEDGTRYLVLAWAAVWNPNTAFTEGHPVVIPRHAPEDAPGYAPPARPRVYPGALAYALPELATSEAEDVHPLEAEARRYVGGVELGRPDTGR